MKTTTVIRTGRPDDASSVADLLGQLGHPLNEEQVSSKIALFERPGYCLLVCEYDGKTAGFISLHWFDKFHSIGSTGRITAFCVDERIRARGIGGLLLAAAEQLLRESGCREIEVTTNMRRSLTPEFYRKHGYEQHSHHFVKSLQGFPP